MTRSVFDCSSPDPYGLTRCCATTKTPHPPRLPKQTDFENPDPRIFPLASTLPKPLEVCSIGACRMLPGRTHQLA